VGKGRGYCDFGVERGTQEDKRVNGGKFADTAKGGPVLGSPNAPGGQEES